MVLIDGTDEQYYPWLVNEFIPIYTLKDSRRQEIRRGSLIIYRFNFYVVGLVSVLWSTDALGTIQNLSGTKSLRDFL